MPDYSDVDALFPQQVYPITGVDTGADELGVAGDLTTRISAGRIIYVAGSTGNDGRYTVSAVSYLAGTTTIGVEEDITSATVDGYILDNAIADTLPTTQAHDDTDDRDSAAPDQVAGAHLQRLANELRALGLTVGNAVGVAVLEDSGLVVRYTGGRIIFGGGAPVDVDADYLTLTDNATNYVEVDSSGTVSANTSAFTSSKYPLAVVTTVAGSITGIEDKRSALYIAEFAEANLDDLAPALFDSAAELTISGGVVTRTQNVHTIDTEGDAATDDLDTISGGSDGMLLILRAEDAARTVVLKDGTGNLNLNGSDVTLDTIEQFLLLYYDGSQSAWVLIGSPVADLSGYYPVDGSSAMEDLSIAAATELTISSGAITRTQLFHNVDTEGDAATDDLTDINGASPSNQVLILKAANAGRTVVIKDNSGNILTGGRDIYLNAINRVVVLVYDNNTAFWHVVSGAQDPLENIVCVEWGFINVPDSTTNDEIHRFVLQSGELFILDRIELQLDGGGTDANVSLNVYDGTTQLDSVTAGSVSKAGAVSAAAATILVRVNNSSGGAVDVTPIVRGRIVSQ